MEKGCRSDPALFFCGVIAFFDKNGDENGEKCHFFPFPGLDFLSESEVKIKPGPRKCARRSKKLRRAEELAPKKWEGHRNGI